MKKGLNGTEECYQSVANPSVALRRSAVHNSRINYKVDVRNTMLQK